MDNKQRKDRALSAMMTCALLILIILPFVLSVMYWHRINTLSESLGEILETVTRMEIHKRSRYHYVKVTAYSGEQFHGRTATQTNTTPGWTAACSPNLIKDFLGRKIYVQGYGVWKADEITHHNIKDKTIDLCLSEKDAANFKTQENILVVALD